MEGTLASEKLRGRAPSFLASFLSSFFLLKPYYLFLQRFPRFPKG
jgi:hypothetical protein